MNINSINNIKSTYKPVLGQAKTENKPAENVKFEGFSKNYSQACKAYAFISFKGKPDDNKIIPDELTIKFDFDRKHEIIEILSTLKCNGSEESRFNKHSIEYIGYNLNYDNVKYLDLLLKARDSKLSGDDIVYIIENLNQENGQYIDLLLKAKDGKLSGEDIGYILEGINKDNEQYLDPLLKARDGKLSGEDIDYILMKLNQDNEQYLESLLKVRDGELSGKNIRNILQYLNQDNGQHLDFLLKVRNGKLSANDIRYILIALNENNEQYLDFLLKARDGELSGKNINNILQYLNQDNGQYLDSLLKVRDSKLSGNEMGFILGNLNKDNGQYLESLLKVRDSKLSGKEMGFILGNLNKDNEKYLDFLLKVRDGKLSTNEIGYILRNLNKDNEKYLDPLLKVRDGELSGDEIGYILRNLNKDNEKYLDLLLKARDGKLSAGEIGFILQELNKDNEKYLDILLKAGDGKLPGVEIGFILQELNKDNGQYIYTLANAKNSKDKFLNMYEIKVALSFGKLFILLQGKANINQLSLMAKRNLIKQLIKFNSSLFDYNFKNISPLFPQNKDEYCSLMQDLTINIDNSLKQLLNENSKKQYFDAMDKIKTILATDKPQNEECLKQLDKISQVFSEFYTATGEPARVLDECTVETLQNIVKDERYKNLNDKDKKILELAALFKCQDDDKNNDLALDAHSLSQMLGFTEQESIKLYNIIQCQNCLKSENNEEVLQDMSFKLRTDNTFKMAQILIGSSLKPEKDITSEKVMESYINYIQSSTIPLPQTKIPRASQLTAGQGVEEVEINGIKNKVIYMNQKPNLENIGFEKNTNMDNFYALVHAFDNDNGDRSQVKYKARILDAVKNIETDTVLSTSFIKANDYKVFRHQGVILDVDYNNIGAAYYKDFGTGHNKDEKLLEHKIIFSEVKTFRNYIPDKLKEKLGYNDSQYIDFTNKIQNCKSLTDIEKIDKKAAETMQNLFSEIENGKRENGRQYNEVLVLNPKIQGVFAYDEKVEQIPEDLRKFANEKDLPIIIFGTT